LKIGVLVTNTENFLETYNARFLEVLVKEKLLGYFLVLWSAYFILAIFQELLEDSSSSFAYTGVNIILSLTIIAMAVVLVLLGRKVLGSSTIVSVKQKLLGYFLVLWGAGWFLNAALIVLPNYGYLETANTGTFAVLSLINLVTAVVLVLLGRKVLGSSTIVSVKQKLLGYFLVLWGTMFFVTPIEQALYSYNYLEIAYTGSSIILSLIFIAMAVVLVLLGRKVLGSSRIVSVKQKLLGYFLVLWGAGWFLNAILNSFSSYDYWENIESYYNIIPYTLFIATAVVLVLLGRKVLGSQTKTST
jgi:uncharacterized membrane protein YidH (DUF202 family)